MNLPGNDFVQALTAAPSPPRPPPLGPSDVHLWLANLELPDHQLERCAKLLADDERTRAQRFRFERDQRHYTAARAILRFLLTGYTNHPADALRFSYNSHGKPALPGNHPVRFNISHSHGWAILGFTLNRDIGVDIERIRPDFAAEDIAQRFFSPAEVAALRSMPSASRTRAFFDCWTRKEAFMKATGMGIFLGLQSFAVSLAPGQPPALLHHETDPTAASRWALRELRAPQNYVGAVAVEGSMIEFNYWHFALHL